MNNIEEDIQRQTKNTINYYKDLEKIEEIPIDILRAMYKDVLAERKQDKARIQELEEENKKLLENSLDVINDMIPKQKVKDKIEENNIIMINMQNRHPDIYVLSDEWRNAKAQNKVLEELLEDK